MHKILHTTISPCGNERRIFNEALTASRHGYKVEILALKTPELPEISLLESVIIQRISIKHWQGGPWKFISFNLRLFWRLLRTDFDILHAHDLWVLPASAMARILKRKTLVYDAHEYYRGLEIFNRKRLSGRIWRRVEGVSMGVVDHLFTINSFHEKLYRENFSRHPEISVLHNFPSFRSYLGNGEKASFETRKSVVLFQGIFKPGRGLIQLVNACAELPEARLWLIGFGELEGRLREQISQQSTPDNICFWGKQPLDRLMDLTAQARVGVVLFEPSSINYRFALPNKFFEYVHTATPVVASHIPTFEKFLSEFEVGILVDPADHQALKAALRLLLTNESKWNYFHKNCLKARKVWNWEAQEQALLKVYRSLIQLKFGEMIPFKIG